MEKRIELEKLSYYQQHIEIIIGRVSNKYISNDLINLPYKKYGERNQRFKLAEEFNELFSRILKLFTKLPKGLRCSTKEELKIEAFDLIFLLSQFRENNKDGYLKALLLIEQSCDSWDSFTRDSPKAKNRLKWKLKESLEYMYRDDMEQWVEERIFRIETKLNKVYNDIEDTIEKEG